MYLKRLELQGFKSFPEKIKLEFNKGITAVVGPNGSGKSNIADAVRWVLGEKSAKSLRGAKMEDIIFNGTANRKPLGFAEVSMVMDNTDGKLNIDYSEVTVTRRVFRSGESDYLINGSTCRLKDILELFMDTGVGKEGYSIIGQGRIDEILSTKSEDRRMLFEEAAGIVKYKTRRIEATNKLEKERQNLVRVNDIITELESQVGPLEIQAEKTKKYLVLADRLKLVQVNIFVDEVDKYEVEIKKSGNDISNVKRQIADEEDNQTLLERKKAKLREELNLTEEKMAESSEQLGEKRSVTEQKENDIKLCQQEIAHINENIERLNVDIDKNKSVVTERNGEIELINSKSQGKAMELKIKKDSLAGKMAEFEKLNEKMSQSEELLNRYNADIIEKMNQTTDLKGDVSRVSTMLEQFKSRRTTVEEEQSYLQGQLAQRITARQVLEKEKERIEKEGSIISDNISRLSSEGKRLSAELSEATVNQNKINKGISEKNSRFKILSELEKEYEGYYGGVKAILKQRDSHNPGFKGICGAVGEVISLDEKYETAIEIALGGAVQNIIARTEEDVKKAIGYLKSNNKGRATFLPMNAIKGKTLGNEKYTLLKEKGVIGIAKELIKYSPEYESIMSNLLERVIVVDNIDNGIALARKSKYTYKIVTLDGDLFNAGGSMTGGSVNKKSAGIFSRGREINLLQEELKTLFEEQVAVAEDIAKMKEISVSVEYKLEEAKEELQQLAIERTETNNRTEQANTYILELEEKGKSYVLELRQLSEQMESAQSTLKEYNSKLEELNEDIEGIYGKLDEYQSMIQSDRDVREESNKVLTDMQVEINQLENELYSYKSDISRITQEIKSVELSNEFNYKEIEKLNEDIYIKSEEINCINEEVERLRLELEEMQSGLEDYTNRKTEINQELETIDSDVRKQLETISNLKNELTRLEYKHTQMEEKCSQLYNSMWEDYEITYPMAKECERLDMLGSELQKEERQLKSEIKSLGSVNVDAVEEYRNVKERYDFLTNQRNDIISAEEKLGKIIVQLEGLMENQFREQFKVMSENFTQVFAEMFGGGYASLKLADENDILNTGIDIVAQPPGKALQNMMLLSGGERALTAMALLFAILKMKPSPFCILDEIEAALDDANVNRYADYLKKFIDDTQFVVITHRKGTMEAADILYGVTMQEQGVSKLVSVKFDENKGA